MNPRISKKIKPWLKHLFFSSAVLFAASDGFSQWTDPILTSGVTPIKAVHVTELRTQINSKLGVCLQPAQAWTNSTLTPRSTTIKKIDLDELRTATTNLVNAYRVQQALPSSPPVYTDAAITARTTPIRAVHFDELRTFVSGATCTPDCPAQTLAWNVGADACSASAPATAIGSSAAITDITVPVTGNAQFNCEDGGVWAVSPNAGATCGAAAINGACAIGFPSGVGTLQTCASGIASAATYAPACGQTTVFTCIGVNGGTNADCSWTNAACPICGAGGTTCTSAGATWWPTSAYLGPPLPPSGKGLCSSGWNSTALPGNVGYGDYTVLCF